MMPNQSPEPTAVGAVSSAVAVRVASRRWLGFLGAASVNLTGHNPVLIHSDFLQKAQPEIGKLRFLQTTFKHAVLHPHAKILANPRHAGQAFGVGDVVGQFFENGPFFTLQFVVCG